MCIRDRGKEVGTGEFGADMKVELLNNGPVTIQNSYKQTPGLLNNHRMGLSFIFETSKLVYFIYFSYELQI